MSNKVKEPCHKCGEIDGHSRQCNAPVIKSYDNKPFDKQRDLTTKKYSIDVSKLGVNTNES